MITCSEAVRRLWEYLDAMVDEADREAVEEHLSLCRRCCGELEFAVELRRRLLGSGRGDIPADVLRRLNQTLEELS
ncbi:zf-HC2 domain-containing protein [Streptomyces sp. PSKA54]|uniref:Zf-HC2 domain-containing protein n=1 Tax=Streptomyces himalayensis subsp. aureolus TaxID=2758039 RepID=A0A7W2HES7_9ACTN|nr:zf-HC2 domain-containing protein [Streptomyces himalayensis]MBA4861238.1 zf-HC2 domain-containing protein [Streptomyces himalayensis subsp. aureolus]